MLVNLHIQNLAIIDEIDIDFKKGLTAITGETGAGKSLIIDAIELLTGARSSSSIVRTGASKAVIEGTFENINDHIYQMLVECDVDVDDDFIVLRRDIYANGKSVFRINGQSINLSLAELICDNLIDIHVQNDNLRLFNSKHYLSFIDNKEINSLVKDYQVSLNNYLLKIKEYQDFINKKDESIKNIDYLVFQLDELKKASLKDGELEELEEELKILNNYENIFQYLQNIKELIKDHNIREQLYYILDNLKKLKSINPNYIDYHENIENAYYNIDDLENYVSNDLSSLEFDEDRLNEINSRINEINRLTRKYHKTVKELIIFQQELSREIDNIDNSEVYLEDLEIELKQLFKIVKDKACKISKLRKVSAEQLKKDILKTLKDLMLDKVKLEFVFDDNKINNYLDYAKFNKNGTDSVQILISFNPGESLKPLSKIASGGESSRVMLAIKTHLFANKGLSTVIFDEIDTGVSGIAAQGVADKLKQLSKSSQVFSITHLPIVASVADHHLYVSKNVINEQTNTCVTELSYDERINILAEMISPGDSSGKAKEVASLMLNNK